MYRFRFFRMQILFTLLLGLALLPTLGFAQDGPAPGHGPYMVFAHYMPCFKAYGFSQDDNYWFDQSFSPEKGARGGLTSRPIVYPLSSKDSELDAVISDIRLAKSYGIDGFLVDELATSPSYDAEWQRLLKGAEIVGGFKIGIMPDYATLKDDETPTGRKSAIQTWITLGAGSPAMLRYDGKPVVFPYGDGWPDGRDRDTKEVTSIHEKQKIVDPLASAGIDIAYAPCTGVDWDLFKKPYANDPQTGFQTYSFAAGSFSPLAPQALYDAELSYWPKSLMMMGENAFLYYNRGWHYGTGGHDLSESYRTQWAWNVAHRDRVRWVMLVTWNDWGETAIAPSVNHYMAWQPITRYYADWFKTGKEPVIAQDSVEIFHRPHPLTATPTQEPFDLNKDPNYQFQKPNDVVEAVAFLKAPAVLVLHSGGKTYRQHVERGVQAFARPFALGVQSASVERKGKTIVSVVSPVPITSAPGRQNLWYIGADSQHAPRTVGTQQWTDVSGTWKGTAAKRSGTGLTLAGEPMALSDCSITAKLAPGAAKEGARAGIVAHASADGTHFYSLTVGTTAGKPTWQLAKKDKDTLTVLSSGPFHGDLKAAHTLRLDCVGEYRIGYIDSILVTQVSDYPVTTNYQLAFGQGGITAEGTPATFQNVAMHSYDPDLVALSAQKGALSAHK